MGLKTLEEDLKQEIKSEDTDKKDARKSVEGKAKISPEKRKSIDEKPSASTSSSPSDNNKEGASNVVLKRSSPTEKLRETLISFDKSLDMLLVDLIKEDTDNAEVDDDDAMDTSKSEDKKCDTSAAGTSQS